MRNASRTRPADFRCAFSVCVRALYSDVYRYAIVYTLRFGKSIVVDRSARSIPRRRRSRRNDEVERSAPREKERRTDVTRPFVEYDASLRCFCPLFFPRFAWSCRVLIGVALCNHVRLLRQISLQLISATLAEPPAPREKIQGES